MPGDSMSETRDSESPVDRLGLGEFLKEVEDQGADAIGRQSMADVDESPETKEMTPEQ